MEKGVKKPWMRIPVDSVSHPASTEKSHLIAVVVYNFLIDQQSRSEEKYQAYRRILEDYFGFLGENCDGPVPDALTGATPTSIRGWLDTAPGSGISKAQRLSCVRGMYGALVAEGIREGNPASCSVLC